MKRGFDVYGETRLYHDSVCLWVHQIEGTRRNVVNPTVLVVESRDLETTAPTEPSLELDRATAVNLMTALWKLGYRPLGEDFRPVDGEVRAMGEHLEDMRRLVFKLGVEPRRS